MSFNGDTAVEGHNEAGHSLSVGDGRQLSLGKEGARARGYTLAVHVLLTKDDIDQPHMHLMFSERVIDETTSRLAEDRFFKRNGAKKGLPRMIGVNPIGYVRVGQV